MFYYLLVLSACFNLNEPFYGGGGSAPTSDLCSFTASNPNMKPSFKDLNPSVEEVGVTS